MVSAWARPAKLDDQAREGHAGLAAVTLPGSGERRGRAGARQQVGQQQATGARGGGLPSLLACAGQVAP